MSAGNRRARGEGEVLYMKTLLHSWNGKRCYAHVCYNHMEAARELDGFILDLALWQDELSSGNEQDKNKWAYKKYFIVKETPKRGRTVKEDKKAVEDTKKKHMGFFCILTKRKTSALEAIGLYRSKQAVENCFDGLQKHAGHDAAQDTLVPGYNASLFIQFIALVLLTKIRMEKTSTTNSATSLSGKSWRQWRLSLK